MAEMYDGMPYGHVGCGSGRRWERVCMGRARVSGAKGSNGSSLAWQRAGNRAHADLGGGDWPAMGTPSPWGCGWVRVGAGGCGWVRVGAGGWKYLDRWMRHPGGG